MREARRLSWESQRLAELRAAGSKPKTDSWKAKYRPADEADPEDELVAGLPRSWTVATLGEIAEVIDPNPSHRYPTYANGSVPLLSTREFRGRDGWDASARGVPLVPLDVYNEQNDRCRFSPRDIIMARKGRLGLARHSPPLSAYVFSHTLFVVKVCPGVNADYVLWFLRLDAVVRWLRREMNDNTGVPTLGKATTERLPIPLPPAGEQSQIVTSVERMTTMCDDLETRLRARDEKAARLAEALVAQILA